MLAIGLALAAAGCPLARAEPPATAGWPVAGGDAGSARYSPLADIDRANVARLRVAWTYRHGDFRASRWRPDHELLGTAFEATPILAGERLVFPTPFSRVIALDARSGSELWSFDPEVDLGHYFANNLTSRGVAFWGDADHPERCAGRVFLATIDARLVALDLASGTPCRDFGRDGTVDLREGVENLHDPDEYNVTSPPTIVGDVVIVGSSIPDLMRRLQPSGVVRAYDVRSGRLRWSFHPIPRAGEPGSETWEDESWRDHGGANVWSTITADLERGLVFLPVSTAGPDYYGVDRPGANLFVDSVVALEAATGRRVWHFQTVHHDLWDYDLAAPPTLVRVRRGDTSIDAVAQATKTGFLFLLDRESGRPLFPVEERPVPQSDLPGEATSPTQPFPVKPPPIAPIALTEQDIGGGSPEHRAKCLQRWRAMRYEGPFTPPSTRTTLVFPGSTGGANWSGGAFDGERGLFFVPVNSFPNAIELKALPESNLETSGGRPLRSLLRLGWWYFTGRGTGLRYQTYRDLFVEDGRFCHRPPWGLLTAVDLNAGTIRWQVPVGERDGVSGLPNLGPPLATAGGLVFHAGSRDPRLRAHDADSGALLAHFELPAGLHAGPLTYKLGPDEPQYLVVAAGGHHRLDSPLGDWILAYTLGGDAARARGRSVRPPLSIASPAP